MTASLAHDGSRGVVARPPSPSSTQTGRARLARRGPSPRFLREVDDPAARQDIRTLALFVRIYCDGHHGGRERTVHRSDAETAGAYPEGCSPVLCAECSEHLAYGEARRVFCTLDPKPFCAHCSIHCFKDSERAWNRRMMRYSGPRSLLHGYALDGARHLAGSIRLRLRTARGRLRPVGR
ncbi:nitrous oxide-stimulated promoter family protein [Brachybacterium timonense]|uniref:nitrous oxide-stimulated promoter family protein n=1 Tax=Brachybacterium timonense TaxID=2050896 RepID=UPI000D0B897F|nr:nitrous oxide-stimulated promoter family protein [Brachybacterium timonense]